jgi:drug/metabolite transporter (DMT)-like permease
MKVAEQTRSARAGALIALCSAMLFGVSTPLAKVLLGRVSPWMLAGLLYTGAGVGLALFQLVRRLGASSSRPLLAEAKLTRAQLPVLAAVTVSGGIIAPVLLLLGLSVSSASSAALLLNLEGVFTLALAWIVFHENLDVRIACGAVVILLGAALLSWRGSAGAINWGAAAIAGACLAWAIDNNLTRSLSASDPVQIAALKTSIAGLSNLILARLAGDQLPAALSILSAGGLGLLSYGLSVVLFVHALRLLGTARTGAYFSTAPFVGAVLAIPVLGERITAPLLVAAALMAVGLWLYLTERHDHEHEHAPLLHEHRHVHDIHHQHAHGPGDPAGEPHSHVHAHARMQHTHPHFPDIHHRHRHHGHGSEGAS